MISVFAAVDANYGRMVSDKVNKIKAASSRKRKAATRKAAPLNPPRVVTKSAL